MTLARVKGVRRTCALAASLAGLLLAAGCGGDDGAVGGGADVAPASSALYVSVNTDFEGDQWRQAEALLDRFPAGRETVGDLLAELEREDLDFERDVKPAVGPEVVFIAPDFEGEDFVVLTQPDDPAKFQELARKGDDPGVAEEIEGWWAAAENQEALDSFKEARGDDSLSENDEFTEAMDDLPEDAVARVFLNGEAANRQIQSEAEATPDQKALLGCFGGSEGGFGGVGFALAAEEGGARLVGTSRAGAIEVPDDGSWDIVDENVGEALGFFAVRGLGEQIRRVLDCVSDASEDVSRQIAQAELVLGVSISEDLLPLFDDETVFAVEPLADPNAGGGGSLGIATFSLVTEVEDEEQAVATLDKITSRISAFADQVSVDDVTIGGAAAKRVTVSGEGITVFYGVYDGRLVVTTTEDGIANVAGGTGGNSAYEAARDAADAPEESAALTWIDVPAVVEFANTFIAATGEDLPEEARENLGPLRSLLFWSEGNGDRIRFEGFLQID
jgi:hypothetical protein